jgi:hypothetical protein
VEHSSFKKLKLKFLLNLSESNQRYQEIIETYNTAKESTQVILNALSKASAHAPDLTSEEILALLNKSENSTMVSELVQTSELGSELSIKHEPGCTNLKYSSGSDTLKCDTEPTSEVSDRNITRQPDVDQDMGGS